jgi:hypothetical protein
MLGEKMTKKIFFEKSSRKVWRSKMLPYLYTIKQQQTNPSEMNNANNIPNLSPAVKAVFARVKMLPVSKLKEMFEILYFDEDMTPDKAAVESAIYWALCSKIGKQKLLEFTKPLEQKMLALLD